MARHIIRSLLLTVRSSLDAAASGTTADPMLCTPASPSPLSLAVPKSEPPF
jgi:hypothetical protein